MEYRFLGRTGITVSNMCFGGNTFGEGGSVVPLTRPGNTDEASTHALLDSFSSSGGNFIDTSNVYSAGNSERIIGSWLARQDREQVIVSTKVGAPMNTVINCNAIGLSRKNIMTAIDASLQRLGTDYVDIYYMHMWDYATAIEESLTAMNDLVRMGKVRYVGASNVTGWQLQKMVEVTRQRNLAPIVALQAQYNLLERGIELELTDLCKNENIGLMAYMPLKSGWLTGKLHRGVTRPPEGSRIAWATDHVEARISSNPHWDALANEHTWTVVDTVEEVAKQTGKSVAQVALRWVLQKEVVTSVVFGAKTHVQLTSNMAAASGWELSVAQMAKLDESSKTELPYPYCVTSFIKKCRYS